MYIGIYNYNRIISCSLILIIALSSCSNKTSLKDEQIKISNSVSTNINDSLTNSIKGNASFNQISTRPNSVILTGFENHRLVTIYINSNESCSKNNRGNYSRYSSDNEDSNKGLKNYVPGIEILYGFNLLNVAHYNMKTEKLDFMFDNPVLIKTLYYPSFHQDSIDKKPINRNYYLVSVYNQDTNRDSLINNKDLRRFFYFDIDNKIKIQLLPNDYSVLRSQYDSKNDVLYLYAKFDANTNGIADNEEPIHIFWINLKNPTQAKLLYK